MKNQMRAVREFHEKHKFPCDLDPFKDGPLPTAAHIGSLLTSLSASLHEAALDQERSGDPRLYRAMLSIEELGEWLQALGTCSSLELADALGDRLYVLLGDAVSFSLPLEEIFDEIHKSNMTKMVRNRDDPRMRSKGPEYTKPNLEKAFDSAKNIKNWEQSLAEQPL